MDRKSIIFNAEVLHVDGRTGGNYVEFPYKTEEIFGIKGRVPVICYFNGFEYHGSLVKMGGPCHIIGIRKSILANLKKKPGDLIEVKIEKDDSERSVIPDPSLLTYIESDQRIKKRYNELSFTKKREINQSLQNAKKEETKQNRLKKILTDLGLI